MNKQSFTGLWDHLRQANGIALRCIAAIPADQLESHPVPKMRTPKELVVHLYGMALRETIEGALRGEITDLDEAKLCAGIKTHDDLLKFARDNWNAADRAASQIGDAQLAATVKTPWGVGFPGFVAIVVAQDEFFHHRGQLYTYLRAMGQDVPMMWDFEHNEAAYQPRAAATA
jgi:uncharacterized damage-inducible protein DinB